MWRVGTEAWGCDGARRPRASPTASSRRRCARLAGRQTPARSSTRVSSSSQLYAQWLSVHGHCQRRAAGGRRGSAGGRTTSSTFRWALGAAVACVDRSRAASPSIVCRPRPSRFPPPGPAAGRLAKPTTRAEIKLKAPLRMRAMSTGRQSRGGHTEPRSDTQRGAHVSRNRSTAPPNARDGRRTAHRDDAGGDVPPGKTTLPPACKHATTCHHRALRGGRQTAGWRRSNRQMGGGRLSGGEQWGSNGRGRPPGGVTPINELTAKFIIIQYTVPRF